MFNNKLFILIITIIFAFSISLAITAASEKQAPELQEMVDEGELEPLEERLPEEPMEMDPIEETGEYGGTWQRYDNSDDFATFLMSLYGHSWIRFVDDGTDIAPNLAVDWESNDDDTVWTIHFREGVKWSDGEPFTVDDIMFWWEDMVLNDEFVEVVPDEFQAGGETAEISKIDDYTLEIEYAAPAPLLPERLAMWPNRGSGPRLITPEHHMKQFHPEYTDEYDNYEELEERLDWWTYPDSPTLTAWKTADYEAGDYISWERNPYYWAVDDEGNQLPYIDEVHDQYVAEREVFKLNASDGKSDMQIRPFLLTMEDISMLKQNEEKNNFKTLLWDSGSGSGPVYIPNHNYPDETKRELYRNPEFLKAISHAINRDRINKMVYYNEGEPTTGTLSPKASEYQTEEGKEIFKEWKNLAVEYKRKKAEKMLDELDVVDQDDDGWREMPNGEELTLRIDTDAEASDEYMQTNELVKEDWEEIGLETIINTIDGSELTTMVQSAEFDIRNSWEVGDGPNHLLYPQWMVPIHEDRWAPLYGNWYRIQGTSQEGEDKDKKPRDRSPAWKTPDEDSPVRELQKIYDKAKIATTEEKRNELVYDMIEVHLEHGPFFIGTVANYPRVGVVKNYMKNVPEKDDLFMGGFLNPSIVVYPGIVNPPTFWMDK
ncbi:MAG: ABC transporter substrate-binding protein [Bacillota bacterium]